MEIIIAINQEEPCFFHFFPSSLFLFLFLIRKTVNFINPKNQDVKPNVYKNTLQPNISQEGMEITKEKIVWSTPTKGCTVFYNLEIREKLQ